MRGLAAGDFGVPEGPIGDAATDGGASGPALQERRRLWVRIPPPGPLPRARAGGSICITRTMLGGRARFVGDRMSSDPIETLREVVSAFGFQATNPYLADEGADALARLEQLRDAAGPALELLAAEGYDAHHEGGFPVCAEYENLRAALAWCATTQENT